MNKTITQMALCLLMGTACNINAQVTLDPSTFINGYMSWSPVPGDASGYGGSGASGWGVADLPATFSGAILTLSPNVNTYDSSNPYWVNADGSGANIMDASIYAETVGTYVNTSLTFTFDVQSISLADGYTADAFIKDFGPGYSFNGMQSVPLSPGEHSVTFALTGNDPNEIVQYGFELIGPDADPATVASLGSVQIAPVPEPSTMALAGLGGLACLSWIRRRR